MSEDDRQAVEQANRALYDAFEARDMEAMAALSIQDERAGCVHPGWDPLRGWLAVGRSWQAIFANTEAIHFSLSEVDVYVDGATAVVRLIENIVTSMHGREITGRTSATNVFVRRANRWLLLHHHASPASAPLSELPDEPEVLH